MILQANFSNSFNFHSKTGVKLLCFKIISVQSVSNPGFHSKSGVKIILILLFMELRKGNNGDSRYGYFDFFKIHSLQRNIKDRSNEK